MKILKASGRFVSSSLVILAVLGLVLPADGVAWSTLLQGSDAAPDEDIGWPRTIEVPEGTIVVYQPQVETYEGTSMTGRSAVSVTLTGETEPVFGTVWFATRVETDRDARMVYVESVRVPRVRFPNATVEQEAGLSEILENEIPKWDLSFSLDRLLAALEALEKEAAAAENLGTRPPHIIFTTTPSILVTIDGEAKMTQIEGSSLMRVVNTPFLVVLDSSARTYYLYAGEDAWYQASSLDGAWQFTQQVPSSVAQLAPDESEIEVPESDESANSNAIPQIVVATEPTELIYTDGAPEYTPVTGGELMYISNSDNDLLLDLETQQHYVLLSGRWFTSAKLEGPWSYVASDQLPESFMLIPADSEIGDLRTFVAGTEESQEAVLDAQIPQTAAVDRHTTTLEIEYDGEPQFAKIEGTSLEFAVNTPTSVIKADGRYYACNEGVWFVANAPTGPWAVSTTRPTEVEQIPPESPVYNVKYVYIYDSTPDVVYVGYTPGYAGTYVYNTTVVYGTGYYYPGWYGTYYYPRPATWGFGVRYSPWYGWSFGVTYSNGWFTFGIGFGGWNRWHGGWWGPGRYHGYWRGYHRGYYHGWNRGYYRGAHAGYRAGYRAGQRDGYRRDNIYRAQNNPSVRPAGQNRANRPANQPSVARARNNVYSDSNGNVYRQNRDGSFAGAGTARAQGATPQTRPSGQQARPAAGERPSTGQQPSVGQRPSTQVQSQLQRQSQARAKGTQRTNQYQRSRSSSGGARRSAPRRRGG